MRAVVRGLKKEKPMNIKDKKTAYHEAGHFVAAHKMGWKTKKITIIPDTGLW